MTETLLKSILFGFGIYTIIMLVFKPMLSNQLKVKIEKFDNSACLLTSVTGLIYMLVWLIIQFKNIGGETENSFIGPYWLVFWLQPTLLLTSQLLWYKKLRKIILIRIIIALTLMISIESIIVFLTQLHRDYMPSIWSVSFSTKITEWIYSVGLFALLTIIFHLTKTRLKIKNDV